MGTWVLESVVSPWIIGLWLWADERSHRWARLTGRMAFLCWFPVALLTALLPLTLGLAWVIFWEDPRANRARLACPRCRSRVIAADDDIFWCTACRYGTASESPHGLPV